MNKKIYRKDKLIKIQQKFKITILIKSCKLIFVNYDNKKKKI